MNRQRVDLDQPKTMHVHARMKICVLAIVLMSIAMSAMAALPNCIANQLPDGYQVIATAHLAAGQPKRNFELVALARKDEAKLAHSSQGAPARPLLVFEQKDAGFVLAARNDHVVMKADEGGQCDPFMDGDATIASKGRYFTIQMAWPVANIGLTTSPSGWTSGPAVSFSIMSGASHGKLIPVMIRTQKPWFQPGRRK